MEKDEYYGEYAASLALMSATLVKETQVLSSLIMRMDYVFFGSTNKLCVAMSIAEAVDPVVALSIYSVMH